MSSYRWTKHRVVDAAGAEHVGDVPISMWWVARAAAEETLQGSPMVSAWLKLFRTHLSDIDRYALRWRGDLAESAELRRAYSGLYGRFVARALLSHHLKLSRFVSLKRNGVTIPGSAEVKRSKPGDIPDWLAWDDQNSRFVLCEAKGSLAANDFLAANQPQCVKEGKRQFGRVASMIGSRLIHPGEWVAAVRWGTDIRGGQPTTILWDPPVDDEPFGEEEADLHRTAITRSWLESIAPGLGWTSAEDLLSTERQREALVVVAQPGDLPEEQDWPRSEPEGPDLSETLDIYMLAENVRIRRASEAQLSLIQDVPDSSPKSDLALSDIYRGRAVLTPRGTETAPHKGAYLTAMITRFGIQPVRSQVEFETLLRQQDRARKHEDAAMLVGIPLDFDPKRRSEDGGWLDGAGIAPPNDLAVFDLRRVEIELLDRLRT